MASRSPFIVAHDMGPSNIGKLLAAHYPPRPHALAYGGTASVLSPTEMRAEIEQSSVVLVGMSSKAKAGIEIVACHIAREAGVPIALLGDAYGILGRPWFSKVREWVSAAFVISPTEITEMQQLFPKSTKIVAFTSPAWEDYFTPKDRSLARTRCGLKLDEYVVLVAGGKKLAVNVALLHEMTEAMQKAYSAAPFSGAIVYAPRPDDAVPRDIHEHLCSELSSFLPSEVRLFVSAVKADEVVPAANMVMHTGISSVGIHAAARRIVSVQPRAWWSEALFMQENPTTGSILARKGASLVLDGGCSLTAIIQHTNGTNRSTLQCVEALARAQASFLPNIPQDGDSLRPVRDMLERVALID